MFELMVSISDDKSAFIDELHQKLGSEIKRDGGIIVKQNYDGRASLALAVQRQKREYYKSKILDEIIFVIIDEYKFNFYKNSLQFFSENVVCQSFLKAISIFDAEIDREVIKKMIEFKAEILVDSFYYFKLQSLRNRWQKTASIINQNQILTSQNSMIGVLKYLTMTSENFMMTTDVVIGKQQIKIKSYSNQKIYRRNFEGHSNFLTEIVRLNPVKINLKVVKGFEKDQMIDLLGEIFPDKIYFIK